MEDLSVRFANLFDKVESLLVKYARSRDEILRLKKENEELRRYKEERDEKIRELNDKIAVLRTVKEIGNDGEDRSAIRQKVNEYIKEIDRCIALLNG
jgi:predicted RNase H-like nuclease (RuvC/YqgF family)